jgi:hypothetical protein
MRVRKGDGQSGNLAEARFEGWASFPFPFSTKLERHSFMANLAPLNPTSSRVMRYETGQSIHIGSAQPTILVATVDNAIANSMRELLEIYPLRTVWAKGVDEVKSVLARENVAACFCGFWLVDGTYRDVVRHLRRQQVEIPAIVVCEPACPHEYRDYLAALNIRAFDFICHPYRKTDMERILRTAISERGKLVRLQTQSGNPTYTAENPSDLHKAG